jgi:DNA-binding NtrC family response regulator
MVTGPDGSISLKLLLLEAQPGNLEAVRTAWPQAAIVARAVGQELGVTDQISREKVQVVFCDLSGSDCPGVGVLQQIRRVHPQLPLVAVLPTRDFAMALTALRSGVDDLLAHPLSKDVLLAAGVRVSHREEFNARQAFTLKMAKRSLDDLVLLKAIGETTRSTDDLQIANQVSRCRETLPRTFSKNIHSSATWMSANRAG